MEVPARMPGMVSGTAPSSLQFTLSMATRVPVGVSATRPEKAQHFVHMSNSTGSTKR